MHPQSSQKRSQSGLTLVELLLIVVIVGIVAGLLLPATSDSHPSHDQLLRARARDDMYHLQDTIRQYEATYGHPPVSESDTNNDVTYGLAPADIEGFQTVPGTRLAASNSDLIAILLDLDLGMNAGHKLNPKRIVFFEAKMVSDTKSYGISSVDWQFRDPWGHPYVISVDANDDGSVRDPLYCVSTVISNNASGFTKHQEFYDLNVSSLIWSRGPDGKASQTVPFNAGVNHDNPTSFY